MLHFIICYVILRLQVYRTADTRYQAAGEAKKCRFFSIFALPCAICSSLVSGTSFIPVPSCVPLLRTYSQGPRLIPLSAPSHQSHHAELFSLLLPSFSSLRFLSSFWFCIYTVISQGIRNLLQGQGQCGEKTVRKERGRNGEVQCSSDSEGRPHRDGQGVMALLQVALEDVKISRLDKIREALRASGILNAAV